MDKKLRLRILLVILALTVVGAGLWLWSQRRGEVPRSEEEQADQGTVETAKTISESVPEIQTNPGEKVPEINPLDRANPFKYTNPLR